jgi:hypothetical protein
MSSFTVVSGMALTLLGGFLVDLSFGSGAVALWLLNLPLALGIAVIAVIISIRSLFGSTGNTKGQPKDASPSGIDSFQVPPGERG